MTDLHSLEGLIVGKEINTREHKESTSKANTKSRVAPKHAKVDKNKNLNQIQDVMNEDIETQIKATGVCTPDIAVAEAELPILFTNLPGRKDGGSSVGSPTGVT